MKMKVWKFNNNLEQLKCNRDDFIANFSEKETGINEWERLRKIIENKTSNKKYEIVKSKNYIYVFSNGFTADEIVEVLKNKEVIQHDDNKNIIYLMWKDIEVCKWESSEITENVKIIDIYRLNLMPIGTVTKGKVWDGNFADWLKWRSIPYSRKNMKLILQALNLQTTEFMIKSCNGAGLNDFYWYKEEGSKLKWKDVNYYNNEWYNGESKLIFLKQKKGTSKEYLKTPDCVSIGNQPKCWIREKGKNYLLKADKYPIAMESFTEELSSRILCDKAVNYTMYVDEKNDLVASKCNNFLEVGNNKETVEFVTANWYLRQFDYKSPLEYFELLGREIRKMGIDSFYKFVRMLLYDYLFLNADRHWDNFGFIIDKDRSMKFAPLYDNGDSFGRNTNITDANCYILKDYTEEPDYVIDYILKLDIVKRLIGVEEIITTWIKRFYENEELLLKKYKDYDITEYTKNRDKIVEEIDRRYKYITDKWDKIK